MENRFSSRVASSIIGHCTQSPRSPAPNLNSWCPSSETSRSSSSYSVFSVLQVMRPMSKLSSFNYLDPGEEHLRPFSFARTQNHQPALLPPLSFFSSSKSSLLLLPQPLPTSAFWNQSLRVRPKGKVCVSLAPFFHS